MAKRPNRSIKPLRMERQKIALGSKKKILVGKKKSAPRVPKL